MIFLLHFCFSPWAYWTVHVYSTWPLRKKYFWSDFPPCLFMTFWNSLEGNPLLRYPSCGERCDSMRAKEEVTFPAHDPRSKTYCSSPNLGEFWFIYLAGIISVRFFAHIFYLWSILICLSPLTKLCNKHQDGAIVHVNRFTGSCLLGRSRRGYSAVA